MCRHSQGSPRQVSRLASNGKITREHGVMVGTTTGRVVELGLGSSGDRLVPSAAVTDSIAQSLHVENGILMMLEGHGERSRSQLLFK